MSLGSYVVGVSTLVAGVMFLLNPQLPEHPTDPSSWWEAFSGWMAQPPPHATINLFGVTPDVIVRPRHYFVRGAGFHRKYRLSVGITASEKIKLEGCKLRAEWTMPKDVIVDQWLLHRASLVEWKVGDFCDLEAPVYSDAAQPFKLSASADIKSAIVNIDIPDVMARYQQPSTLRPRSPKFFLHPPTIMLECEEGKDYVVRSVEEAGLFKPLDMCVPVARPLKNINNATYAFVFMALLYIIFQLHKA
jgi:hypothetical protein